MDQVELLKRNLPGFLKTSRNLLEYVEAVGEFLNETQESIENISYPMRYNRVGPVNLDRALRDLGFTLPSNITDEVKTMLLRDAVQLILKTGTEDAFVSVLKMIGINAEVQYAWAVSPEKMRRGYKTNLEDGLDYRYDVSFDFTYQDFLYGDEIVTSEGVYATVFQYDDFLREHPIENVPIYGQSYSGIPNQPFRIGKTPYVMIAIDDTQINLVETESVDPITGEIYSYSTEEKQFLVNEILSYFLFDNNRPTHMRVFVVITPNDATTYNENASIYDEFETTSTYVHNDDHDSNEGIVATDSLEQSSTISYETPVIGDPYIIGFPSPAISQFSLIEVDSVTERGVHANIPRIGNDNLSTPNAPANQLTGDLEIEVEMEPETWRPSDTNVIVAKRTSSSTSAYQFSLLSSGNLSFVFWDEDGTSRTLSSTVPVPIEYSRKHVKVIVRMDDGSGQASVTFQYSIDGEDWITLSETVGTFGVAQIRSVNTVLRIGGRGSNGGTNRYLGKIFRAKIRNGVGGPVVVDFNPRKYTGGSTIVGETGEVWTLNANATIEGFKTEVSSTPKTPVFTYHRPSDGETQKIPLWAKTEVKLTSPIDSDVTLIGLRHFHDSVGEVLTTVNSGMNYTFNNNGEYHGLLLDYAANTSQEVAIEIKYG